MRAALKTSAFMAVWAALLIAPWLIKAARGWEIETDCDQVVRAPEAFGYFTAVAALVSLPFALGAAVQEGRWIRALCLLASSFSLVAIAVGVLVSMGMQSTQVDCAAPPWPEST